MLEKVLTLFHKIKCSFFLLFFSSINRKKGFIQLNTGEKNISEEILIFVYLLTYLLTYSLCQFLAEK